MRIAVGVFILAAALGVAQAGETGWRSDGTGRYPDAEPPVTFAPEVNVVWAAPLPSWSNASPVVIEDRIFVCAEPDTLIAVEKKTGKILWQEANPVAETSSGEDGAAQGEAKAHAHNGFTSATPVCDGKHVFAVFGNGMIAANVMRGDLHITPWEEMGKDGAVVLDVRDPDEVECGPIPADIRIPLNQLRNRLAELPQDRPIQICCAVGARAYNASRILTQRGYHASLLSGGAETWFCVQEE